MSPYDWFNGFARVFFVYGSNNPGYLGIANVEHTGVVRLEFLFDKRYLIMKIYSSKNFREINIIQRFLGKDLEELIY